MITERIIINSFFDQLLLDKIFSPVTFCMLIFKLEIIVYCKFELFNK